MEGLRPILDPLPTGAPLVIAGPCSAESRGQTLEAARGLAACGRVQVFRAGLWKPRTQPGCFEGVGERGLPWLREARELTGLPTATEVANAAHVRAALEGGVDILWIGARTTVNPFAVQEIAEAIAAIRPDTPVLVKNPVNPDLDLWAGALQRLYNAGLRRLGAVFRGFSTYGERLYRNTPLWEVPFALGRRVPGLPVLCDPSHIGGRADLVEPLCRQALDLGFSGLMVESHPNPGCALSDASQQVTPTELCRILASLPERTAADANHDIALLRQRIDTLDSQLIELLAARMAVSRDIGEVKRREGLSVMQRDRYGTLMADRIEQTTRAGMSRRFAERLFETIHSESVRQQLKNP